MTAPWLGLTVSLAFVSAALFAFGILAPDAAARFWVGLGRRLGGLSEHRVEIGIDSIPYLAGGRGEPLVLLHGFGADKDNFVLAAPLLNRHARLIIPDLPGFGDAGRRADARYRISDQVERVRMLVARLGLARIHLGGSSMGGFIAAEYAAKYPEQVASLWLLDPAGVGDAFDTPSMREYRKTGDSPLLVPTIARYDELLAAATFRRSLIPRSVRHLLAERAVRDFPLHSQILRQISTESPLLDDLLPQITAPTLVVWGDEDRLLNPKAAATIAALIPDCRIVRMRGVGHLPMVERPRAAVADYLEFRSAIHVRETRA